MQKKNKSLITIYEQDETNSDRIFMQISANALEVLLRTI